jgi:hypothetical protein
MFDKLLLFILINLKDRLAIWLKLKINALKFLI